MKKYIITAIMLLNSVSIFSKVNAEDITDLTTDCKIATENHSTSFVNTLDTCSLINNKKINPVDIKRINNSSIVFTIYQHVLNNISLEDSLDVQISNIGLNKVLKFININIFDQMAGISVKI